jgi:hypothetical protein
MPDVQWLLTWMLRHDVDNRRNTLHGDSYSGWRGMYVVKPYIADIRGD